MIFILICDLIVFIYLNNFQKRSLRLKFRSKKVHLFEKKSKLDCLILQKGKKFTKYLHSWNSSFAHRCFCMDVCLAWETKHEGIHFHRMEIQIGQTNLESLLRCHGGEMLPTALLVFTLAHLPFFGNGTGMAYSLTATRWWSPLTNVNIAPELERRLRNKKGQSSLLYYMANQQIPCFVLCSECHTMAFIFFLSLPSDVLNADDCWTVWKKCLFSSPPGRGLVWLGFCIWQIHAH